MKTSEHKHRWAYMYLPGNCWRYCKCGEVEETGPTGSTKPVNEKTRQMVLRKAKLAAYDSAVSPSCPLDAFLIEKAAFSFGDARRNVSAFLQRFRRPMTSRQ